MALSAGIASARANVNAAYSGVGNDAITVGIDTARPQLSVTMTLENGLSFTAVVIQEAFGLFVACGRLGEPGRSQLLPGMA